MNKLNKEELLEVKGGGISLGLGLAIVGAAAFLIGVVDGIIRPLKCN